MPVSAAIREAATGLKPKASSSSQPGLFRAVGGLFRAMTMCSGQRLILAMALLLCFGGWAVFVANVVYTSAYTNSHAMRGYEWLPCFMIWPVSVIAFIRFPRKPHGFRSRSGDGDDEAYETSIMLRMIVLAACVCVGLMIGVPLAFVDWFAPKPHWISWLPTPSVAPGPPAAMTPPNPSASPAEMAAARGLFSSASATLMPLHKKVRTPPDPVAGVLTLVALGMLVAGVYMWWLYATEPERDDADRDGDF